MLDLWPRVKDWHCPQDSHYTQTPSVTVQRFNRRQSHEKRDDKNCTQEAKEHVSCEGVDIDNVWIFQYLGSRFRADGDQHTDVKSHIDATTIITFGKMWDIWASRSTPLKLKPMIYSTGVCSKLTYGSEAWRLNTKVCVSVSWSTVSRTSWSDGDPDHGQVSTWGFQERITYVRPDGKDQSQETSVVGIHFTDGPRKRPYDAKGATALQHLHLCRSLGDILMNVPKKYSWTELKELARNRYGWRHGSTRSNSGRIS